MAPLVNTRGNVAIDPASIGRVALRLTVAVLLLQGCSSTSKDRMQEAAKGSISTTATAKLLLSSWEHGRVPSPYVASTLRSLHSDIEDQKGQLRDMKTPQASQASDLFQKIAKVIEEAQFMVQHDDRKSVGPLVSSLAAQLKVLNDLQASLDAERGGRGGSTT